MLCDDSSVKRGLRKHGFLAIFRRISSETRFSKNQPYGHALIRSCALQPTLGCATIERLKCSPLLSLSLSLSVSLPSPSQFFSLYATRVPCSAFTADLNGIRDRNVFPVHTRNFSFHAAPPPSYYVFSYFDSVNHL